MRADLNKVTRFKAKFEVAIVKKINLDKRVSVSREEVAKLRSLVEAEETKLTILKEAMKIADMAISSVGDQAMQKAKLIASTNITAGILSTLVAKVQCDKETIEQKCTALKTHLDFL